MRIPRPLRHAARRLLATPSFTIAATLTLALGIGATAAVFSVVDAVLLRPLPYGDPDRLVALSHTLEISGVSEVEQSDASYLVYRRENRVFGDVGAYRTGAVNLGAVAGAADDGGSERVPAGEVTASLFSVLRAAPLRGRLLAEADERPGADPVALLAEGLWRRRYGADPAILGRHVEIDGVSRTIVGILPADFRFPAAGTELWIPAPIDAARTESATFDYHAVARLRDGISAATAAADLQRLLPRIPEAFPGRLTAQAIAVTHMRTVVRPLRDVVVGDVARVLWVVLGAVSLVLLVACANVANLFLARGEGRQHELAVRRALGAGARAMLGEFLSEGIVVAAAGGALGLVIAAAGVRLLRSLGDAVDIPRLAGVGVDARIVAFGIAVTGLAALLVSAIPGLRAGRTSPSAALGGVSRGSTAGRERHRARNALVAAQVALALVLLVGAGLMLRSFSRLRAVDPGFDPSGVLTFRVALPASTYPTTDDAARFFVDALDALAATPGVRAVGAVSKLPLVDEGRQDTAVWREDHPLRPGEMPDIHQVAYVSTDYFRAMGIPVVAGRTFRRDDLERGALEVVVSRGFADRYWKGDAIGRRIRVDPRRAWSTVVGVVEGVRGTALERPADEMVYRPLVAAAGDARWTPRQMTFVARAAGAGAGVTAAARQAVRALDPSLPLYHVRAMTGIAEQASARTRFTVLLLAIAAAVALALGAVGIYGVIAYVVSLRTREIGVRLALGASPAAVRRLVSRQALAVAGVGVAIGLAGALALTRFLGALLFEVSATDPLAIGGAAALLLLVALAASWIPAARAAAVDPARALRAE